MAAVQTHSSSLQDHTLESYLKEVSNTHPISAQEETALAVKIKKGDLEARNKLVEANLRFVIRVAQGYQNRGLSIAELISAGNMGLIAAAERFDETRGVKFISYAVWWIRQGILQTLSEQTMVRIPGNRVELGRQIANCITSWQKEKHIHPSDEDIAGELGIKVETVRNISADNQPVLHLDDCLQEEGGSYLDIITDECQEPTDHSVMRKVMREDIDSALDKLGENEREVIRLCFGLDNDMPMTMAHVSKEFNLSRERIRQIRNRALNKLIHPKLGKRLAAYAGHV